MRRTFVILVSLALSTLPALSMAAADKAPATTIATFQRDLVNVLALRVQAKPLLGAALLARTLPDPPSMVSFHALITRAAQAPDAGPAVAWTQLVDCSRKAMDCPNTKALTTLEKQAPDNTAVWLMALGQATRNGDDDAARQALAKAAAADHYDDYHGVSVKALAKAAATLPPPTTLYDGKHAAANSAAGVRALLVFGVASLQPMPGFQAAARLCAKGKVDKTTRATCLHLAKTLVWGSAPLARSLGLHLQETLSGDAAVRAEAKAARRDLVWQVHNFGKLTLDSQRDGKLAQQLLQLARQGGTQMSLMLAALRAAHLPVDAPEGWQPHGKPPAPAPTH